MRLAHSAVVTPHQSGLYETAREIVQAERQLGHHAWIVDPKQPRECYDRSVPVGIGLDADVIIDHSGLSREMLDSNLPVIHCRHGRPRSTFLIEQRNGLAPYTHVSTLGQRDRYKAFLTFWPEHQRFWELLIGKPVRVLPPPVDLTFWTPHGPSGYRFHDHQGDINAVCTDIWRDDADPFDVIHEFVEFAQRHKNGNCRLHLYGNPNSIKPLQSLLTVISRHGYLGEVCGWVKGLDNVFRAATFAISGHRIATRSIREALACGCPVARDVEEMNACAEDDLRNDARATAERLFDPKGTAEQLIAICEDVL